MVSGGGRITLVLSKLKVHFYVMPEELKTEKGEYKERITKLRRIELGIVIGLVLILLLVAVLLLK
jgi:uncharacterized membrane protein